MISDLCRAAAVVLFAIAAYLDFDGRPHALGWACAGLAVWAFGTLAPRLFAAP